MLRGAVIDEGGRCSGLAAEEIVLVPRPKMPVALKETTMRRLCLPLSYLTTCLAAAGVGALTLAKDGASTYALVVSATASAPEQTAARELQENLVQVTGATLPIRTEAEVADDAPQILIGASARAKRLLPAVDPAKLGADGIVVETVGDKLILTGQPPRGTLYAVFSFLEDGVGCRWWTSTEATIPKKPTLEVPELNTIYAPPLLSREAFYHDAFSCPFAVRLKLNGHFMQIPPEYGGNMKVIGWCHTFFSILPPDKYFAEHPDWYSEIGGKRTAEGTQLCLTNDEMRAEFVRNALERLRAEADPRILSISQNDWGGACQCAKCKALEEQEGSPSGPLIHFVNAVAEEIEKEFPKVLVETLAYSYTRHAPKQVKPRGNVLIRLCSIECSFSQPLGTGPQNEKFSTDMEQWSAIAPQLYVWNYVTNFANFLLPHPNLRSLAEDIRWFAAHKTLGLFEQGDAYSTTGDFIRLRTWLLAHLMWDPSRDQEALIREFMEGYYGPAAPPLLQYLNSCEDAVAESDAYLRCYMGDTSPWMTLDVLNQATRLFDQAQAAVADDATLRARVERERLTLDNAWLQRYQSLQRQAARTKVAFLAPADPVAACQRWIAQNSKFGNEFYGEGRPFAEYAQNLARRFRPPGPPPAFCKDLPKEDWVDIQDNLFVLHNPGGWVALTEDPSASDGMAARMPANHVQWATQCPVSDDLIEPGQWHCYVFARCDAKAATGQGLQLGLYDNKDATGVAARTVTLEECGGKEYKCLDLGVQDLRADMYFWVAPCGNPDEVEAVYVDRIVLVREAPQAGAAK